MANPNSDDPRGRNYRLVDLLLMLYIFDKVGEIDRITGDTKLQKLIFLSENEMFESDRLGLHYKFFRWDLGPFSKGVNEDHGYLCDQRLVSESQGTILSKGEQILDECGELLQANRDYLDIIDNVVAEYGDKPGYKLKDLVYDIEIEPMSLPGPIRVEDIPEGVDIYWPIPEESAENAFSISDEWLETLDIILHPQSRTVVEEGLDAARSEEFEPFVLSG